MKTNIILLTLIFSQFLLAQSKTEVMIPVGKQQLEGRLVLPESASQQKVPIVIFLAGSGDGSFEGYLPEQDTVKVLNFERVFIPQGIGVLYFNKRGVGKSTGNWKNRSFKKRAKDVHAVVDYLRALPEIDGKKNRIDRA